MNEFFNNFNERQLEAICCDKQQICVFAGPGTGKTKTLVGKYVYLIIEKKIPAENILCLTFTRKAASEMFEKIKKVCPDTSSKYIGTIHSLGNRILTEDIYRIGFVNKYSIISSEDSYSIIYQIMGSLNLFEDNNITYKDVVTFISDQKIKDEEYGFVQYLFNSEKINAKLLEINEKLLGNASSESTVELKLLKAYYNYLLYQSNNYYLDYNDLILIPNYMFEHYDNILKKWAKKFKYILVDEFQDLTNEEFKFIKYLSSVHNNIFGVGDPDQSIYGFRGATVDIFNNFYETSEAKFDYEQNYRSYQEIIDLSHSVILHNKNRITDVSLKCVNGKLLKTPILVHTKDRYSSSLFVGETIQKKCKEEGCKRSDFAILYRNNSSSLVFEEYFQRKKIPFKVYSVNDFFRCDEIKTALSYLKFAVYKDNVSFLNIYKKPVRYVSNAMINYTKQLANESNVTYYQIIKDNYKNAIYKRTFDKFVEYVEKIDKINPNNDFTEWCIRILKDSGYLEYILSSGDEDKANHMKQLIDMINSFEQEDPDMNIAEEFLNYIALLSDGDFNEDEDKVQLMSIHCSKGLEFKYVFIVDFNEGYIPSSKAENIQDLEEERRVFYVGLTRAKKGLYLVESNGNDNDLSESSFKKEIDLNTYSLIQYVAKENYNGLQIVVGSIVKSKRFGIGIVKEIDSIAKKCIVKFDDEYKEKTVDLNTLIVVYERRTGENDILLNEDIVRKIKEKCCSKYSIGDIMLHKKYGLGIITKLYDNNSAIISFKDISSVFDLNSYNLIKREDYIKNKEL